MWSLQNIVRVALMQVGVVVASVLIAGICHKFAVSYDPPVNLGPYPNWWYHHSLMGFCLPIVWTACALFLYTQDNISDFIKLAVYWLGVIAAVVLACLSVLSLFRGL
jgi:hypothetical protein